MEEWTREKKKAAAYILVGIYLLYLAVQLFNGRFDDGGNVQWIIVMFAVLFACVGAGLAISSVWKIWKGNDGGTDDEDTPEN